MPIDVDRIVGATLEETTFSWSEEDVILYNLGVGAGVPPDDPRQLEYAYEAELKAVPAFGTIPPFAMVMGVGAIEGLDIQLSQILHGDQRLQIHSPIPVRGSVKQTGRIVDVLDKGRGALLVIEVVSTLEGSDTPLFTNTSGVYVRGEGGFGGDRGASAPKGPPDRAPDHVVESPTLPQQALLYRMASGDKNPLHADPAFAAVAGFGRPILHGLCTYGVVTLAVIEAALGGEAEQVGSISARFSGHVFPGETLVSQIWETDEAIMVETTTREREQTVLSHGLVATRD
ncbi:MAG TPA: MaoC/PaaZ C-terminal domain-containing protein [Acidimicrobiia bacterium]|nr:MaoC/PaaZ C-terminal domain-containing protein [Acidimicrobiia bacterium]